MSAWTVPIAEQFISHAQKSPPCRFLVRVGEQLVATDANIMVARPNRGAHRIPKALVHPKSTFGSDVRAILAEVKDRRCRLYDGFVRWIEAEAGSPPTSHVRIYEHGANPRLVFACIKALLGAPIARLGDNAAEARRMKAPALHLVVPRDLLAPIHLMTADSHGIVMPMRLNDVWPRP